MTANIRRLPPLLLLGALWVLACGGGGPCGASGQQCCGFPSPACSADRLSCQSGRCLSCGSEGGPCCSFQTCGPNLFCNSTPSTPFVCQACGHVGQPACVNNLCVTGVFSGGNCVAAGSGASECNGSTPFVIAVRSRSSRCRIDEFAVRANTRDEAKRCAERSARTVGHADPEAIDATGWMRYSRTVTAPPSPCRVQEIPAYSEDDADACGIYFNCAITRDCIARASVCPSR